MKKNYGNLIFNLVYKKKKRKRNTEWNKLLKLNKVRRCIIDKLIKIPIIYNLKIIFRW